MKQPEVVVFDLGKVLVDFDWTIAARSICARSRMSPAEIHDFLLGTPLLFDYETGLVTTSEFFARVREATGFRDGFEEFSAAFADIFSPITPMIELHGELRRRRVPVFIFSNTNELAVNHIRRDYPFFAEFDGHILSYEHQAMKPNAKLYEVVEQMTGRRGAAIIYLDDRAENIEAGAARGWQAVLHETPAASIATVKRTGLLG